MEPVHFDNEDSNHSVNGWIKKEVEDDEFEEYVKQEPAHHVFTTRNIPSRNSNSSYCEMESGDRYEELMNLSKDDLVGRILQQEEDIRYLQDIRHGLEKNVQELGASCTEFRKLIGELTSLLSSFRENQPVISSPPPVQPARSAPVQTQPSRSSASTSPAQASPRSTPNVFSSSSASPRSVSGGSVNPRSSSASSVVSTDRLHAAGSHSGQATVTITRSTNVIIKTEIPSPPPQGEQQPMISHPSMNSASSVTVGSQRSRPDQKPYQTRQQQQQQVQQMFRGNSMQAPNFSSASTRGRNAAQVHSGNVQYQAQQQQQQQRGRANNPSMQFSNISSGSSASRPVKQQSAPSSFHRPQQQQQQQMMQSSASPASASFTSSRVPRAASQTVRSEVSMPGSRSSVASSVSSSSASSRSRVVNQSASSNLPSSSPSPSTPTRCTITEITDNVPVKMPSGITLPSGLTLSLVTPKSTPEPKLPVNEKAVVVSTAITKTVSDTSGRTGSSDGNSSKSSSEKNISDASGTSAATVSSAPASAASVEQDQDDEDDEYFDEIAVLIPDKKSSPTMDTSGGQGGTDTQTSSDSYSHSVGQSPEPYWNSQNSKTEQKSGQPVYHNNDEYMFEEPDDIESGDENDTKLNIRSVSVVPAMCRQTPFASHTAKMQCPGLKRVSHEVYLGEDVSLPKELVDSCIKQGPTAAKLTRNLMQALFPDLRDLASGCNDNDDESDKPPQPSLPPNKVKAIIAQVQKVFPQCKRSEIIVAMKMKCREARIQLTKNIGRRGRVQYAPY